jgi:hypothetical protein
MREGAGGTNRQDPHCDFGNDRLAGVDGSVLERDMSADRPVQGAGVPEGSFPFLLFRNQIRARRSGNQVRPRGPLVMLTQQE